MDQTNCRLISPKFPSELLLEIIQQLPFGDGSIITALKQTHPRIRSLIRIYERSIVKGFIRKELPHAQTDFPCENPGSNWLGHCIKRYDVVDEVMAVLMSTLNCCKVEHHNMALVNTGLLLLYQLTEIEPHTDKLSFLESLSQDPLTALFITIHHSTLTARYHGDGVINQSTYGHLMDANTLSLRCDVEFSFAEGILQLGPTFIRSTFLASELAEPMLLNLYHDHATHDWVEGNESKPLVTQGPHRDTANRERSLWTALLERLAVLVECPLEEVKRKFEVDLERADHSLAFLNLSGKAMLMRGEDLLYMD